MKRISLLLFLMATGYVSAQNTWVTKASLPAATRLGAVSFSIGMKGYIFGGYGNPAGVVYDDLWEWDQATNTWSQMASLPGNARGWATGFSIGTKGYMGTGSDGSANYNDFWEWDQPTNTWVQKANYPTMCSEVAGCSVGTKGYVCDGTNFFEYDPVTDQWISKASFPGSIIYAQVSFSIGTKAYFGTGSDAIACTSEFWEWDQPTDTWTRKADFGGGARNAAAGFSIGGKGYLGTGWDVHYNRYKDLWEYDPAGDTWTRCADMIGGTRVVATGFSIGAKGYIGMGFGTGGSLKDLKEYTPGPLSVEENNVITAFNVYPNPAKDFILVGMQIKEGNSIVLQLFDMRGSVVMQMEENNVVGNYQRKINIEMLPAGIYFLKLSTGIFSSSKKIVKE